MENHCSKCDVRLEPQWKFCPDCGCASPQPIQSREILTHAETKASEKAPTKGGYGGLLFGVLAAPILVIVGTMLCLTGLGAILGIPMIIAAVFAPLAGPMIGLGALKGKSS